MGKQDRKLKRRMQKRQMRLIKGGAKKRAQKAQCQAPVQEQLTAPQRFELTLAALIKDYLVLERERAEDDRVTEEQIIVIMFRFLAGMAIARDISLEQFVEAADGVYVEQEGLFDEQKDDV